MYTITNMYVTLSHQHKTCDNIFLKFLFRHMYNTPRFCCLFNSTFGVEKMDVDTRNLEECQQCFPPKMYTRWWSYDVLFHTLVCSLACCFSVIYNF